MNQSVIAGVGNVYRSEVLHLLGMHPERKGNSLSQDEFDEMWKLIVELLEIGKRHNRIIIADPKEVGKPRSRMNREERLLVYKKDFCRRCEAPIETWKLAADLNALEVVTELSHTDYNGDRSERHEWGYGKLDNPASVLRAKGYAEAEAQGWV